MLNGLRMQKGEMTRIFNEIDLHFRIINATDALNFYFTQEYENYKLRSDKTTEKRKNFLTRFLFLQINFFISRVSFYF